MWWSSHRGRCLGCSWSISYPREVLNLPVLGAATAHPLQAAEFWPEAVLACSLRRPKGAPCLSCLLFLPAVLGVEQHLSSPVCSFCPSRADQAPCFRSTPWTSAPCHPHHQFGRDTAPGSQWHFWVGIKSGAAGCGWLGILEKQGLHWGGAFFNKL